MLCLTGSDLVNPGFKTARWWKQFNHLPSFSCKLQLCSLTGEAVLDLSPWNSYFIEGPYVKELVYQAQTIFLSKQNQTTTTAIFSHLIRQRAVLCLNKYIKMLQCMLDINPRKETKSIFLKLNECIYQIEHSWASASWLLGHEPNLSSWSSVHKNWSTTNQLDLVLLFDKSSLRSLTRLVHQLTPALPGVCFPKPSNYGCNLRCFLSEELFLFDYFHMILFIVSLLF